MADLSWGLRNSRGEWQPQELPKPAPLFVWPLKPLKIIKFLFAPEGFLWPYNLLYALLAVISWLFFTPALERAVSFEIGWIAEIYLRNAVLLTLVAGGLHLRLYITKGQGTKFKYTDKWLAKKNNRFLFRNQTYDNIFWNLVSGCTIWTAYEAITMWAYANDFIPFVEWSARPIYCVFLMVAVLFLRLFHFYWIHRFSHWKPIYKAAHYLHHKNINIGPWSGLSMHPIEHLLYFSGVLLHWIIPSHPIHSIFHLLHVGVSPALGHAGFHKLVTKGERGLMADNYFHYVHHLYFTVNYGTEMVPLDRWFGSFHDGSPAAHVAMLDNRRKGRKSSG